MPILTMTEAAKEAGISRSTLWRKAKAGLLTTTKKPDGSPGVDAAELFRLFPRETDNETQMTHEETALQLVKQAQDYKDRELQMLREQLQKAEERERRLLDQVDRLTEAVRMIEHRPMDPGPVKPWWKFWGGV